MDFVGLPAGGLEHLRLIDISRSIGQHLRTGIGRDGGAIGPHQRVHRQTGDPAGKVPKRGVDGADGAIADGAVDQAHPGMDAFPLQRVLAHQHGFQRADQLRPVHRGGVAGGAEEGMSLKAGIGVDAQQAEVAA